MTGSTLPDPAAAAVSLGWMALTIGAYAIGLWVQRLARGAAPANPVLIAIALLGGALLASRTPYEVYFQATWPITLLLGPATVALGLPLAEHFGEIRRRFGRVALGLVAGSLASMLSGALLVRACGGSAGLAFSMLPKAATTPIAIEVARSIGGEGTLTAALTILGGITAAISLQLVLRALRISDWWAQGLAAGTAGSGIAAARVAPLSDEAAAFAAIGIGLNGLLTAALAPALAPLLLHLF